MTLRYILIALALSLLICGVSAECVVYLSDCGIEGCGCDEGPAIQAAFNNASNNAPCKIVFPHNLTIITNQPLYLGSNIEIDGNDSTLKIKDGFSGNAESGILQLGDYNYLHNLKLNGNRQNINTSVRGITNGISIRCGTVIENTEIYGIPAYSVFSYKTSNWIFRNNFIHDGSQYGISTGGMPASNQYTENARIYDNVFWNLSQVGIKIKGASNLTVSNNTIIIPDGPGFSASGIRLYSADYSNRNVTITGNTISGDYSNVTGNGYALGIAADVPDNPGSIIENNTINSTYRGMAIETSNVIIRNNLIRNSRHSGIWLSSNDNLIINNTLTNAGIMIESSTRGKYNILRYNSIAGGNNYWRSAGDAVYLWQGGNGNVIDFNQINTTRYGVNINYEYGTVWNTTVSNNTITAGTKPINVFYNNTCTGGC